MPVRRSFLSSVAIVALLVSCPLIAATRQWSGGSVTTNNFSDTANWVGGTPPIALDSVRFPASVPRLSPVDDFVGANNSFFVIGFQTGGYTLNGTGANTLDINFITNGTGTNTIAASLPIRLPVFGTGLTTQTGTTLNVNGTINLNGGTLELNAGLNDLATGTSSDGQGTLNLNGVISGTGTVNARFGTIRFGAVNTFTGTTAILNGALVLVDGAVGPVTLTNGTLGGIGTTGAVTATGGTVAPGDSPGILNTGNVSLNSSSTLSIEVNGATVGTQYDQLNVTGTVTLGNATLLLSGTGAPVGPVLTIINNDGADPVSGTFNGLPEGSQVMIGGSPFTISYVGGTNANDVTLTGIAAAAPTITKSFNPSTVMLNNNSDATITVTNPNAFSISNVQFSDTMPAGIDLITQVGGTCSTLATGGGSFSINTATETFSSTSNVLTAGQSCTIVVRVRGASLGAHVNMTSQVTATGTPNGGPASATLTVLAASTADAPTLSQWMLIALATALAGIAALKLRI